MCYENITVEALAQLYELSHRPITCDGDTHTLFIEPTV